MALFKEAKHIAFFGIAGIGMYSVACMLMAQGYEVSGSDRVENHITESLIRQGASVNIGEFPSSLMSLEHPPQLAIYTAAISPQNEGIRFCQTHGIPLVSRADALAYLMAGHHPTIAIAGLHGKSTTTALLGQMFQAFTPSTTTVCGAEMVSVNAPFIQGEREGPFIFEACEYMRSFLSFSPEIALLLNWGWDHIDCYPTKEDGELALRTFLKQSKMVVYNADDSVLHKIMQNMPCPSYTFSLRNPKANVYLKDIKECKGTYQGTLCHMGKEIGLLAPSLPGVYNLDNALATATVGLVSNMPPHQILSSISCAKGVKRRMEHVGYLGGAPVFDDYAHHPDEITSALQYILKITKGRVVCVFQSHTYTRTKAHLLGICNALKKADIVVVADIYPARETDTLGMSSALMAEMIGPSAYPISDRKEMSSFLMQTITPQDTLIVMGAGNINQLFSHLPITSSLS